MQLIVNIVVLAAIYALLACGYVLIYRVSRVMNMAHGELSMLGAYLLFTTASLFVHHPIDAIIIAVVMSAVVGVLVYVMLMRKMTGEMVLAAILTTIAIGILLRGLVVLFWSAAQQHPVAGPALYQSFDRAFRRRANLGLRGDHGAYDGRGLRRPVCVLALWALGRAHACGGTKSPARGAARHQSSCRSTRWPGGFRP